MPSVFLGQCRPQRTSHTLDEMLRRMLYGIPQVFSQTIDQLIEAQIAVVRPVKPHYFTDAELAGTIIRLRDGIDYLAEEQADDLLTASRKDNRRISDRDWLTKEQLALRIAKEVYNENGFPDSSLVSGMYKRIYNPNYGTRPHRARHDDK